MPHEHRNRFDLPELAGAFGDLGTLIPFVVAYVSILKMDPTGILLAFGVALIVAGFHYRTPFPVQPMKAIGAAAITQTAGAVALTPALVAGAGVATGLIWLALAASGLAKRLALWIPKPALLGIVMGLGFSFMLEGIRMMAQGVGQLGVAARRRLGCSQTHRNPRTRLCKRHPIPPLYGQRRKYLPRRYFYKYLLPVWPRHHPLLRFK